MNQHKVGYIKLRVIVFFKSFAFNYLLLPGAMRIQIVFLIIGTIFITILNISSTEAFSYSSSIYSAPPKNIENKSVDEIKYKYCRFQARRSIWGQKRYVTSEGERAFGSSHFRRTHQPNST